MVSRVGLVAIVLAVAGVAASGPAARTPPTGTAMFVAQHDMRLCPSPLCGGYWVALANGVRTRCGDGQRQARCYVAQALDRYGKRLASLTEGALVRGAIERGQRFGTAPTRSARRRDPVRTGRYGDGRRRLLPRLRHGDRLRPRAVLLLPRAGGQRLVAGHDFRRRPPGVGRDGGRDRARPGGTAHEGRPLCSRSLRLDAGRRSRVPRAAPLPQSAAASRLSTSQASRTSSSVVRKFPIASRS